jgi:hypothetical protein
MPHLPDMPAVDRFLGKVRSYLRWLTEWASVQGRTLDDLRQTWNAGNSALQKASAPDGGDWRY